ncbi:MAG: metal-dependent transcriptional regulator [Planctomycetota bacterium]|jgi:DtxR family Mn-dependent transcriptional regulator
MSRSRESEEVLQALFSLDEEGKTPVPPADLVARARVGEAALGEAVREGLALERPEGVTFTDVGRKQGALLARRHRLAERLLEDVLRVGDSAVEPTACEVEHFLVEEVTDSICTLLGHPRVCPHGKPIPPGACCAAGTRRASPVVEALSNLDTGDAGAVAYVHTSSPDRLDRLASFGLVPGTELSVHQTWPSTVVRIGETELAFDRETAEDIFVRRAGR